VTPEERGESKPRRGPCEACGGPRGKRRKVSLFASDGGAARYVLCDECSRKMGAPAASARPNRFGRVG
jgi:hypothetical protein